MSKTPTAEEVLGLYEEYSQLCGAVNKGDGIQSGSRPAVDAAFAKYIVAHAEWKNAQGPVTREWFVERFRGLICEWELFGICWLSGDVFLGVKRRGEYVYNRVPNPTRSKIEALVEMLGGAHGE